MENPIVAPIVTVHEGHPTTTSLAVAEYFGKDHANILKAIRELDCSKEFAAVNFNGGSYKDKNNQSRPLYHMTKNGFVFLVMGFTGKEAAKLKEAYITAFDRMEEELRKQGFLEEFQHQGELPNSVQLTLEWFVKAKTCESECMKRVNAARRLKRRCERHLMDLALPPLKEIQASGEQEAITG